MCIRDRRPGRLSLSYEIEPSRRGRWGLGPLLSRRTDPPGLARIQGPMGPSESVAVWPATAALVIPMSGLAAEATRAVLRTRSPSAARPLIGMTRSAVAGQTATLSLG